MVLELVRVLRMSTASHIQNLVPARRCETPQSNLIEQTARIALSRDHRTKIQQEVKFCRRTALIRHGLKSEV